MKNVQSNMAGTVIDVLVSVGDTIKAGEEVVILESMKMEIPITSEFAGTVTHIKVQAGDFVNDGDVLIECE
jgi:acetyl-CoA carboxylase biotin carboxyl carrier protein